MKKITILFLVMLLPVSAYADEYGFSEKGRKILLKGDGTWEYVTSANEQEHLFRNISWGVSPDVVIEAEPTEPIYNQDNILGFNEELLGLEALSVYIFIADQLIRGKYVITEEHSNKTKYVYDYESMKKALTEKYGKPNSDNHYWYDDLFKDDRSDWGIAISTGDTAFYTSWNFEDTEIILFLNGDNYDVSLGIEYNSVAFSGLEDAVKKQEQESKL